MRGDFAAIIILPHLNNIYHIRYFPLYNTPIYDMILPYQGDKAMLDVRGDNRQLKGLEIAATAKILRKGKAWSVPSQSAERRYTVWLDSADRIAVAPITKTAVSSASTSLRSSTSYSVSETLMALQRSLRRLPCARRGKHIRQDWSAYNAAQTGEKAKFLDLLRDLCGGIAEPERQKNGRPPLPLAMHYSPLATKSTARFPVGAS